ncbi:MAG: hypothetical protein KAW17_01710 [Candidatus Eisenbacteria sp.]|nr:hypothetical protein [Candidatus Eisenbacteria bacterium]
MTTPSAQLHSAVARFPFIMVITAMFLKGAIFLFVNVPLLIHLIRRTKFESLQSMLESGIFGTWVSQTENASTFFEFSAMLLLSLLIGIALTPLESTFRLVVTALLNLIPRLCHWEWRLFSTRMMSGLPYVEVLSWFFRNPEAKGHWEWQLLHFFVYWGFALNSVIFTLLTYVLVRPHLAVIELIVGSGALVMFMVFASLHSLHMYRVHEHYSRLAGVPVPRDAAGGAVDGDLRR